MAQPLTIDYRLALVYGPQRESSSFSIVNINGSTITKDASKTLQVELLEEENSSCESDYDDQALQEDQSQPELSLEEMKTYIVKTLDEASCSKGKTMTMHTKMLPKNSAYRNKRAVLWLSDYYSLLVSKKPIPTGETLAACNDDGVLILPIEERKTNKIGYLTALARSARDEHYVIHGRRKGNKFQLFRINIDNEDYIETPGLREQLNALDYEDVSPRGPGTFDVHQLVVQLWFDTEFIKRFNAIMQYGLICTDEHCRMHIIHCSEVRFRHVVEILPVRYGPELAGYDDCHEEDTQDFETTSLALWTASPWLRVHPISLGAEPRCRSLNIVGAVEYGVICIIMPPSLWTLLNGVWDADSRGFYINWFDEVAVRISSDEQIEYRKHNRKQHKQELWRAEKEAEEERKRRDAHASQNEKELLREEAASHLTDGQKQKRAEKSAAKTQRRKAAKLQAQQEAAAAAGSSDAPAGL